MAKKREFISFLRGAVSESAASTFTELEIDTNLSAERGVMMNIHSIEFEFQHISELTEAAQGTGETIFAQVTRESKTAIVSINDSDVIAVSKPIFARGPTIGTDAGPLYFLTERVRKIVFEKPIPYVKPSIFLGIHGSDATQAHSVFIRIGFSVEEINRTEFLELLVALQ